MYVMSVSFNIGQLRAFLRQSKAQEKDMQEAVSIFDQCDENKDSMLAGDEVPAFSKMCLMKLGFNMNNIIRGFLNNAVSQSANLQEIFCEDAATDITDNSVISKNKQNLRNACITLMDNTGLFVHKYGIDAQEYTDALKEKYQRSLHNLPETPVDTADFAMNILFSIFKDLKHCKKKIAARNAIEEVAELYKNDENANIHGILCKDISANEDIKEKMASSFAHVTEEEKHQYIEIAKEAKKDIINNFYNMVFPEEVNRENFFEKLKNYNPENITHLDSHYRFGLKLENEPSKADIAVSIISDILGMNGDKGDREIKSEITLRQKAVDNVMKMYDDDMTLRGTKFSEVRNRAEQHQKAIDEARGYINSNFEASGLGKQVDKNLFIECLNSITLDIESKGDGRVEDGVLAIETNDNDIKLTEKGEIADITLSKTVKLLIHEAYHLYLEKIGQHGEVATKEEEATAEMLALRTMANLCNNDPSLKPFKIYGHPINYYISNEAVASNTEFNSWVSGYTEHEGTAEEAIRKAQVNVKL